MTPEGAEGQLRLFILGCEAFGRRQFKSDAGQMLGRDGQRIGLHPDGGVMNDDTLAADRLQDHEVVQVPVDDRRQGQQPDVVQLEAKRATRQVHLVCHLDQSAKRHPLQRHRMAAAQRVQVDPMPVVGRDHRQACKPALRRLGLHNTWQPGPAADVQEGANHPSSLRCRNGLNIQSTNVRLSRMISALSDMSGWSGIFLP